MGQQVVSWVDSPSVTVGELVAVVDLQSSVDDCSFALPLPCEESTCRDRAGDSLGEEGEDGSVKKPRCGSADRADVDEDWPYRFPIFGFRGGEVLRKYKPLLPPALRSSAATLRRFDEGVVKVSCPLTSGSSGTGEVFFSWFLLCFLFFSLVRLVKRPSSGFAWRRPPS